MIPAHTKQLGLWTRHINVETQKIDGLSLKIFGMVIAGFQVVDEFARVRFF